MSYGAILISALSWYLASLASLYLKGLGHTMHRIKFILMAA